MKEKISDKLYDFKIWVSETWFLFRHPVKKFPEDFKLRATVYDDEIPIDPLWKGEWIGNKEDE